MSSAGSSGLRPATLGYSGAVGPRPITQSELATALALASTPESSAVTPTIGNQVSYFVHLKQFRTDGAALWSNSMKGTGVYIIISNVHIYPNT